MKYKPEEEPDECRGSWSERHPDIRYPTKKPPAEAIVTAMMTPISKACTLTELC